MSFDRYVRSTGKVRDPASVAFSVNTRAIFSFGSELCKSLGWGFGTRIELQIGRGEDFGKVRVIASGNGFTLTRAEGVASRPLIRVAPWRGLVPKFAIMDVPFERVEGGIQLMLPAHALQSVPARAEPPARPSFRPIASVAEPPQKRALAPSGFIQAPTRAQLMGKR